MQKKKLLSSNGEYFDGPLIISPSLFHDDRGFFYESWNFNSFNQIIDEKNKDINFVQDNHSFSKKGVLRGLHFQVAPKEQGKLVRCIKGSIFDVIVDLRKNYSTFSSWGKVILTEKNREQLWIPAGFAHGFLTTSNEAEVLYKTTEFWFKKFERTLKWDDKILNINWPNLDCKITISQKDKSGLAFEDF